MRLSKQVLRPRLTPFWNEVAVLSVILAVPVICGLLTALVLKVLLGTFEPQQVLDKRSHGINSVHTKAFEPRKSLYR